MSSYREFFLQLVRAGIGHPAIALSEQANWPHIKVLADEQGLTAVVLDGINSLSSLNGSNNSTIQGPPRIEKLQWIGEVQYWENTIAAQQKAAEAMARLFHENDIRTYVLKGLVISECYPQPNHRVSVDMDCYLTMVNGSGVMVKDSHEKAWKRGNELIKTQGHEVSEGFYKNSTFHLPGLMVENHLYMTPFRGNRRLKKLEVLLQSLMDAYNPTKGECFEGTYLFRPPVMVSALFIIEHAYSHFLHEGLTWRMVLDWQMFCRRHKEEIEWSALEAWIDEFGFRKFYDSYYRLGLYLTGETQENTRLTAQDRMMLDDIWAPLDLHETLHGVKAKFQLAGNYWRARWKYEHFTDTTWVGALMEWVLGAVFNRQPRLG